MSAEDRTISITATGAPDWWLALSDRVWKKIARGTGTGSDGGNTIYQARPVPAPSGISPSPYVFSYSGGCVDQERGELLVHGGGHGDYAGNEVYALNLRSETPGWSRLVDPSPGCFNTGTQTHGGTGQYAVDYSKNGAPASNHSSNNLVFANGKMWLPHVWGMYPNATGTPRIFWFDREDIEWHAGTWWRLPADTNKGSMEGQPSFYLELDDALITGATHYTTPPVTVMAKIDANTGAVLKRWTDSQFYPSMDSAKPVVLPGTKICLMISTSNSTFQVIDFSNDTPTQTNATITNNAGTLAWRSEVTGAFYHEASNAIVCGLGGTSGEDIVVVDVPANPKTGPWVARRVSPANVASPSRIIPPQSDYVYGRFNIINDMGDGRSALVYMPSNSMEATYVMALPAGGIP